MGAGEQEVEKKEEVVESRITVNRGPTSMMRSGAGTFLQSRFLLSHVYQMLRSHFQNIPNSKHTIFYAEYFLFDKEILSHLTHKASLPKNKSAVAMLPCVVCSFKAISEKHLTMHMQTSMMIV